MTNVLANTLLAMSTGPNNVVVIHKEFVQFTGSLEGGMLLNQLLYWTPRGRLPEGWIAKTDDEFTDELCLTTYALRKARNTLEAMGVLETTVRRFNGTPTTHYRIVWNTLTKQWSAWCRKMDFSVSQNPTCGTAESITESTTEGSHLPTGDEPKGVQPKIIPVSYDGWMDLIRESNNRQAELVKMHEALYPDRRPPAFSYVARVAKKVGGAAVLADYFWRLAPTRWRPHGDVLAYILSIHGKNAKEPEPEPEELTEEEAARFKELMEEHQRQDKENGR